MESQNFLQKNSFILLLLAAFICLLIWSAIKPYDWGVWKVEISSVLVVFFALLFTGKKFRFSNLSYFFVFLWLMMHTVGAHYSFERVPFGFITDTFGFERNHYDRVAHFVIGLSAFGVAEFAWRKKITNTVFASAFFGLTFIMAMANAWELIEWAYAEIDGGEVGAAFLGSQGDIWDAQKDMLCDTLGALLACIIFAFVGKKVCSKAEANS